MHVSKRNLLLVHIWCSKHHNKGFFLLKNYKINLILTRKDIDYRYAKNVYLTMEYCLAKNIYIYFTVFLKAL